MDAAGGESQSGSGNADSSVFACRRCGACCRQAGFVRLEMGEPEAIASALGMADDAFANSFTELARDRRGLVLKEKADGACILLDDDGACRVNAAKPRQCREYPFTWRNADSVEICPALAELERAKVARC